VLTVANDYPSVMSALNHGKPLQLAAPHSRVLADIRALAASLTGAAPAPAGDGGDRLSRALARPASGPPAPRAIRVLHIEDDVMQQQAVALHLAAVREFTCAVTPVASEAGALELFRGRRFDVVLLDYHLEQGNGLACLRQLRGIDPIVPIVVVSGVTEPQVAAELLEAGADDFLGKENLSSERLAQSLSAAVARADACKPRLYPEPAGGAGDGFLDRVKADAELLRSLRELHRAARPGRFSAARIQRLVDQVCAELGPASAAGDEFPRRALLTLFLRLFAADGEREAGPRPG
jgi:CheY-like chemotaxis protein